MKVGVLKETTPGERRVALVPEMVARLRGAGLDVLVQSGAGDGAWFADSAYAEAGASIVSRSELLADSGIVVGIGRPDEAVIAALRPGQALVGAAAFGRFFPLLITAAGTARPAKVLVLGTGVAGLQAIGTAKRLGAVVSAYDVRPQTKTEVESLGATFIELSSVGPAAGRRRRRPRRRAAWSCRWPAAPPPRCPAPAPWPAVRYRPR